MKSKPKVLPTMIRQHVNTKRLLKPSILLASSLLGLMSSLANAQSSSNQGSVLSLEEVVVTARRREESLQDVPIAITALDENFLRTQGIGQVEDLGTKVPSLRISQAGGSLNEPMITLRGQRQGEAAFNQDPAVPMYFNDIVIAPTQGSNLGLYDLQNLQVLKGPQGTLFGRNSTGGAVLMTPKLPGNEFGGYAEFKLGDYNLRGFEGAVDIPVSDAVQMRLSGRKLDRDGYQENIADNALHGKDYRDEHSESVRFSLNVDTGSLTNYTVLAYDEAQSAAAVPVVTGINYSVGLGFAAGVSPVLAPWGNAVQENIARDDPWKVKSDLDGEELVRNTFASNTTEFQINDDLSIKNIVGYRGVVFRTATDIDGTEYPVFGSVPEDGLLWAAGLPWGATLNPPLNVMDSEFFSDEIQLLGTAFGGKLEWMTGGYWSKLNASQDRQLQQGPFTYDSGYTDIVNTSYAVFMEGTYSLSDEWSVTAGARQSWEGRELSVHSWSNLDRTNCVLTGPNGSDLTTCERNVDEDYSSPTWRISASYAPVDAQLLYGSVSTGYRAGGFNTRGVDDATLTPFDEETVITYEIGHKADWDWLGFPLRSNVAIYFQDYEDIQNTVSFFQGNSLVTRTENASKAQISGLEVELTAVPTDRLTLTLAYSYVDAQFKEREDLINGVQVDTSNNDFSYVPPQTLTASATYTLPVNEALGEMTLMASVYWQDDMSTHPKAKQFGIMPSRTGGLWSAEDVEFATKFSEWDDYAVWNARFDWRSIMGSGFDFAAYVNNAADEEYVLGGLNVLDSGGYGAYHYGAPRTVGASLHYNF
ncbi:TonB-dependent receptor [Aestuariicella hydrocarbonica]|uniref:TonB-dependent receptor n=1 Tax=Pseudomaricurvus hydrocarbonicus TaxID=1470433 RepID=A0A9E5MH91_9GAMM|nr:TonB-dependent receptor [Aestuariicella hydrocarbonica]NHO65661.1 TonB-dependent receptor [Aestuariicella hydrocarbonica]